LVLTALKRGEHLRQRDIAAAVGIEDATLTHHLNRMEADGLVTRKRVAGNRRTQLVSLTSVGEGLFTSLRRAAVAFDQQLRADLSEDELAALRALVARLRTNVTTARHGSEGPA
jgi:MarR family transcriptional regulator for hemolysin